MQHASQVFTHGRGEVGRCHPQEVWLRQCGNESPVQGGEDEICLYMELSASPVPSVPVSLAGRSSAKSFEIPMGNLHREHQDTVVWLTLNVGGKICLFPLIFPFVCTYLQAVMPWCRAAGMLTVDYPGRANLG